MNKYFKLIMSLLSKNEKKGFEIDNKRNLLSKLKISDKIGFDHSYNEIFEEKVYDIKFNSEAPLILDCGSNIGLSIIYFKTHYPKAIIYGFEPDLRVFELLKENLSVFNFSDVSVYNSAVWSSEGFIEFNPEGSLAGSVVSRNRPDFESYKVKAISLRPYLEDSKIDFLKLDIEGAEYEVLNNISDLLFNVENLFVEYHSVYGKEQQLANILQIIKNAGFRYFIKNSTHDFISPFTKFKNSGFDLQLNIFCVR
jgi:FkbM family methyltransferase